MKNSKSEALANGLTRERFLSMLLEPPLFPNSISFVGQEYTYTFKEETLLMPFLIMQTPRQKIFPEFYATYKNVVLCANIEGGLSDKRLFFSRYLEDDNFTVSYNLKRKGRFYVGNCTFPEDDIFRSKGKVVVAGPEVLEDVIKTLEEGRNYFPYMPNW